MPPHVNVSASKVLKRRVINQEGDEKKLNHTFTFPYFAAMCNRERSPSIGARRSRAEVWSTRNCRASNLPACNHPKRENDDLVLKREKPSLTKKDSNGIISLAPRTSRGAKYLPEWRPRRGSIRACSRQEGRPAFRDQRRSRARPWRQHYRLQLKREAGCCPYDLTGSGPVLAPSRPPLFAI